MSVHDDIAAIVANMESSWNAGDGDGFARDLAEDADFVTVRAEHHRGKKTIATGHQGVFDTIYKGSTNRYQLSSLRLLGSDVAVAHVDSELVCPSGPLMGTHKALFSIVLHRSGDVWKIVSFHNTLAPPELS